MLTRALFWLALTSVTAAQQVPPTSAPAASPAPAAGSTPPAAAAPVRPEFVYSAVHVNGPYIAMTFDDGPHATLTPKLLDLLKERKIKATFFVIGKNAAEYPDILKRIAAEGHEIANHSWSHPDLAKMSQDTVRGELSKTQDAITNTVARPVTLMRPPYGALQTSQKQWVHDTYGYRIILWDVDPLDWRRPGAAVVSERILKGAKPGSIILAHDIHPGTVEAMPGTLDQLIARGFQFVTVSDLIKMEVAPTPAPGKAGRAGVAGAPAGTTPAAKAAATPMPFDAVLRAEPQLSPEQAARLAKPAEAVPTPTPAKKTR